MAPVLLLVAWAPTELEMEKSKLNVRYLLISMVTLLEAASGTRKMSAECTLVMEPQLFAVQ